MDGEGEWGSRSVRHGGQEDQSAETGGEERQRRMMTVLRIARTRTDVDFSSTNRLYRRISTKAKCEWTTHSAREDVLTIGLTLTFGSPGKLAFCSMGFGLGSQGCAAGLKDGHALAGTAEGEDIKAWRTAEGRKEGRHRVLAVGVSRDFYSSWTRRSRPSRRPPTVYPRRPAKCIRTRIRLDQNPTNPSPRTYGKGSRQCRVCAHQAGLIR